MKLLETAGNLLKSKWKEIVLVICIPVISALGFAFIKAQVAITAYKFQEKQTETREVSYKKQINALKSTLSASKKTVKKYKVLAGKECDCEPKKYEEVVYENITETSSDGTKTETETDTKTEVKNKIRFFDDNRMWQVGGGYDIFSGGWYVRCAIETGEALFIELQYPILFDGQNRLRVGAGLRF